MILSEEIRIHVVAKDLGRITLAWRMPWMTLLDYQQSTSTILCSPPRLLGIWLRRLYR
jgi:hypothetical protein